MSEDWLPTPEEQAFVQDIRDHPEDLPRLAYADWLVDHGNGAEVAWAELIRAWCEYERPDVPPRRWQELGDRVRHLWGEVKALWEQRLGVVGDSFWLDRGFVEEVTMRIAHPGGPGRSALPGRPDSQARRLLLRPAPGNARRGPGRRCPVKRGNGPLLSRAGRQRPARLPGLPLPGPADRADGPEWSSTRPTPASWPGRRCWRS